MKHTTFSKPIIHEKEWFQIRMNAMISDHSSMDGKRHTWQDL